eukprot:183657-Amphidinium_carterae.1
MAMFGGKPSRIGSYQRGDASCQWNNAAWSCIMTAKRSARSSWQSLVEDTKSKYQTQVHSWLTAALPEYPHLPQLE